MGSLSFCLLLLSYALVCASVTVTITEPNLTSKTLTLSLSHCISWLVSEKIQVNQKKTAITPYLSLSLACFSLFFLLFLNLRVNFLLRWLIWLSYSLFDINYWVHWSIVVYVVEIRNLLIGNCKYLFSFSDYSFFINLVTIVFYKFSD